MSNKSVVEFKKIVETAITNQNDGIPGQAIYIGCPTARFGDFVFVSAPPKSGRPSTIGQGSEHRWGVYTSARVEKYRGHIALVAIEGNDDSLLRRWEITSPPSQLNIPTEREIIEPDQLERATELARSPHLYPGHIAILGQLSEEESAYVDTEYARLGVKAKKLSENLEAMDQARRVPLDGYGHELIN